MSRSRKTALGSAVVLGVALCAFVIAVLIGQGLAQAGLWATVLALPTGVVAAAAAVWPIVTSQPKIPVPPELAVPTWVVDRPKEISAVVAGLLDGKAGTVGVTTGLQGAGGFGKTTLARVVCTDRRVRKRFRGYVYLVTVGRDVRGAAAITAKVNDVIKLLTGEAATFTDPELAGRQLGALLGTGPRRLLVLDDVWDQEQLAPFADGHQRCSILVTTRNPSLLAGRAVVVRVDQMSPGQSRALLTYGLPPLDPELVDGLLAVTGRWPLLLRLVNKILADAARAGADVLGAGEQLLAWLRKDGPAAVDDVRGPAHRGLGVGKPADRALAVRATITASTSLLDPQEAERFAELSLFAEDETIPFSMAARLWQATGGLGELEASQLCARLGELGLASLPEAEVSGVALHDVVRDFLRGELGAQRLATLNGVLLDAVAAGLPPADPPSADPERARVSWWKLNRSDWYLWEHLIEHLRDAGRHSDAEGVACDLRWVGARLQEFGPAAPAADLALAGTPRAARLGAVLARTAHLLAPTEPAGAVVYILHSRVAADPDWGPQVAALRDLSPVPRLANRWPLPDLTDPALRRILTSHKEGVSAVTVAPDGSWLATGSSDGTVRTWDTATWQERATLTGHKSWVTTAAVAPDGSWLATGSSRRTVQIWDTATWQERATLTGHKAGVRAGAIAVDGSWLATGSVDGTVRIWDTATWQQRATLTGHKSRVSAVAVAPDGSWLAAGSDDGTVRIWDTATWQQRATLAEYTDGWRAVHAVAVAPDGSWLAAGDFDGTTRVWDIASGQERATLTSPKGSVRTVAVARDGSWLAAGSDNGTVQIWDTATWQERATLTGHKAGVDMATIAVAGSWLATGSGEDRTVRIWDTATWQERATLTGHKAGVHAGAIAVDGSWLATGSDDGTVRIWDTATWQQRATLTGHKSRVSAVAVAPDGSWLAAGSGDGTVRIWDTATWQERATLPSHTDREYARAVHAVAVAPDGSWLAAGSGDRTVRIWDTGSWQERATLTGELGRVNAVAIAPDGSWLATGSYGATVRIWDTGSWQERVALTGELDLDLAGVNAVAIAPDGSWLATGAGDGMARIWDTATWQERATLTGHKGLVSGVTITPDGSWLAASGSDGTVRIWDTVTGQGATMMRVEDEVRACIWLGTGGLAAAGPAGLYVFDFLPGNAPTSGVNQPD